MNIVKFNTFQAFIYDKSEVALLPRQRIMYINSLDTKKEKDLISARIAVDSTELLNWIKDTIKNNPDRFVSFDLRHAKFRDKISGLDLSGSYFDNVDFSACSIENVIFSKKDQVSYFDNTCFDSARIENCSFSYSKMGNVSFHKAVIKVANYENIGFLRHPDVKPLYSGDDIINDYENDQILEHEMIDFSKAMILDSILKQIKKIKRSDISDVWKVVEVGN